MMFQNVKKTTKTIGSAMRNGCAVALMSHIEVTTPQRGAFQCLKVEKSQNFGGKGILTVKVMLLRVPYDPSLREPKLGSR